MVVVLRDLLSTYDPRLARLPAAAAPHLPSTVVGGTQVCLVDEILRAELDRPLSFGNQTVVTLDPATHVAGKVRGTAGPQQVAFELLPDLYAVAHLLIGQRRAELTEALVPPADVRVYLTDTLEKPAGEPENPTLGGGGVAVLAAERAPGRLRAPSPSPW